MAIFVKQFSVRTPDKVFTVGERVTGLSEEDEKDLVARGYCEYRNTMIEEEHSGDSDNGVNDDEDDQGDTDAEGGPDTGHPLATPEKGKNKGKDKE